MSEVYKILNKVNGKCYIGITKNGIKGRYPGRNWYTSRSLTRLVKQAIVKYGCENFEISILDTCDIDSLEEREKYFIQFFKSFTPGGYNLTLGGEYKKVISEESRKKCSEANKGRVSWNKGKKMSDEHRIKCSERMKGCTPWNKGKKTGPLSEESMEKSARGHFKKVDSFTLEGKYIKTYESLKSTEVDGFNSSQVSLTCNGKAKTHRNTIFRYTKSN